MRKLLLILGVLLISCANAFAAKIPVEVKDYITSKIPQADIRFDGVIILPDNTIYLPLYPSLFSDIKSLKIKETYPANQDLKQEPDVIIFNNENHTPDMNVERYASLMGETWTSMRSAVQGTRYSKVFCVANQQEQAEVQTAIDSVKDGKPMIVRSNRILPSSEQTINSIKLTDFQESDKIQYLSTFMTYIERNFINLYGMASQGADKVAQQNEAEIKNGAFSSWVEVLSRLSERKKGFEKVKEVFGVEIDYELSEVWQKEYDRLFAEVEEMEKNDESRIDDSSTVSVDEKSEPTDKEDIEEIEKEGAEEE